jgi:hypothetical protein
VTLQPESVIGKNMYVHVWFIKLFDRSRIPEILIAALLDKSASFDKKLDLTKKLFLKAFLSDKRDKTIIKTENVFVLTRFFNKNLSVSLSFNDFSSIMFHYDRLTG